ncbi:hypothetical protein [Pedobacter gandavensis]|uniref:hypothetical protein n=1 Tax=Pedobacter gandavensis TaxID=2679963 RepID=UPI0029303553|nr:hypothetical protein [Pedobacter gandavensis]
MKITSLLIGMILMIGSVFFIKAEFNSLEVLKKGKIVKMEIIDKPALCLGTKIKWMVKLKFQDKIFPKQVSGAFCEEYAVGQEVEMRYLDGSDIVLFPKEGVLGEFIASGLIGLAGLGLLLKGVFDT